MFKRSLVSACAAGLTFWTAHLAWGQVELKNDGFIGDGMSGAGFQSGFVVGEMGASRFTPPMGGEQLLSIQFLFGGSTAGDMKDITLHVYDDSAMTDSPGAELFSGDYTVTASDSSLQEIDLSGDNVIVPGTFRIAIEFQHDGLPSIARDDDGTITASKNLMLAQGIGWVKSNTLGLAGDWIIRAFVEGGGNPTTSSSSSSSGSGAGGMGGMMGAGAGNAMGGGGNGSGECNGNADCPLHQYCSDNGACTFDCIADSDCSAGNTCNSLGQCVGGTGGGCGCRVADSPEEPSAAWLGLMAVALGLGGWSRRRAR